MSASTTPSPIQEAPASEGGQTPPILDEVISRSFALSAAQKEERAKARIDALFGSYWATENIRGFIGPTDQRDLASRAFASGAAAAIKAIGGQA